MIVRVDKDRRCPRLDDRQRGCEGRKGRREDLRARPTSQCSQRNLNRIQTAGDAGRVRESPFGRQLFLEPANFFAQHVPAAGADLLEGREGVFADVFPLPAEVVSWNQELQWNFGLNYLAGAAVRMTISGGTPKRTGMML